MVTMTLKTTGNPGTTEKQVTPNNVDWDHGHRDTQQIFEEAGISVQQDNITTIRPEDTTAEPKGSVGKMVTFIVRQSGH